MAAPTEAELRRVNELIREISSAPWTTFDADVAWALAQYAKSTGFAVSDGWFMEQIRLNPLEVLLKWARFMASLNSATPAPDAPVATAATAVTSEGFTANWEASAGATSYELDLYIAGGYSSTYYTTDLFLVLAGLTPDTSYSYMVRAVNASGESANSDEIWQLTPADPVNPPDAPTTLDATSIAQNSFVANWTASATATSYRLDVSVSAVFDSFVVQDKSVAGTSDTVSGLVSATSYYYRVRAVNAAGTSASSDVMDVTTLA